MGAHSWKLLCLFVICGILNKVSGQCSGVQVDLVGEINQTGIVTSPNYPLPYTTYLVCRWRIYSGDPAKQVLLKIDDISVETSYDYLYIYDGDSTYSTVLFDSDIDQSRIIISSGQFIYVVFTTDYSINYIGFQISYVTVDRMEVTTLDCGTTLVADTTPQQSGYFVIAGASGSYSSCTFDINTSSGTNKTIEIVSPIQDNAYISVNDGQQTTSVSSQGSYVSAGNSVAVTVTGDYLITYKEVDIGVTGQAYSATVGPDTPSCDVTHNIIAYSGTVGYLTSPGYSYSSYPNYVYCSTQIAANNSAESVKITFVDYDVVCCGDFVEVFDGFDTAYSSLGTSWSTGSTMTSTSDAMTITFSSDNNGQLRGFKLLYTAIPRVVPDCVPVGVTDVAATSSEQYIMSMNYPSDYTNYREDYWLITKPSATSALVLEIVDFHLEYSSDDCGYDSIRIYDGPCTDWPVIHKLCGRVDPFSIYHSTGLYVLVWFSSDYSVAYSGFKIVVRIDAAGANQGASTEDGGGTNIADIIVPVVIIAAIIIAAIIVATYMYKRSRKSRRTVRPGTVIHPPPGTVIHLPPPPPVKIMTTRELLDDLQKRYGTSTGEKKSKVKRKQSRINQYMPDDEAGPSGIGTSMNQPHSAPLPPAPSGWKDMSGFSNPAFPPVPFLGETTNIAEGEVVPKPVLPEGQTGEGLQPTAPPTPIIGPTTKIPPPSDYITPLEARALKKRQEL